MKWRRSSQTGLSRGGPAESGARRSGRPAFRTCCPRCAVPFPLLLRGDWFERGLRCAECGVAVREDSPHLAPSDREIGYAMSGLSLIERTAATADMIELSGPFRWEQGLVLVVPASAKEYKDRFIDDIIAEDSAADGPGLRP